MSWKDILKEQTRLDFDFNAPSETKKPVKDIQTKIDSIRWRKPTRSLNTTPSETTTSTDVGRKEESATGDDVGESLAEIRAKFLKKPRGLYQDLADKVSRLGAKSREEAQEQKKILGYIRRLIREANIPEADL